MINQFAFVSGCRPEQAKQYLMSCNWHFEVRSTMFILECRLLYLCSSFITLVDKPQKLECSGVYYLLRKTINTRGPAVT